MSTEEKFSEFHKKHPQIYDQLVAQARSALIIGGKGKIGMQTLFEVVRWNHFKNTGKEPYKINNNFAGHYARLIMQQEDDLHNFFEIRKSRT